MFRNYYFYKNGKRTTSNDHPEEIALQIAYLSFKLDNIDHIYTVDMTTGEIVKILEK
jgi:hypothetical protein